MRMTAAINILKLVHFTSTLTREMNYIEAQLIRYNYPLM